MSCGKTFLYRYSNEFPMSKNVGVNKKSSVKTTFSCDD